MRPMPSKGIADKHTGVMVALPRRGRAQLARNRRISGILVAGGLGLAHVQGAAAQDFRLLDLPEGFHERAAKRQSMELPEAERGRVVRAASADFGASSYFNRPGGSWEDYLADWYGCEQVTSGSRIPGGRVTYVYSPSMLSPRQSGIGAVIGGAIGQGDNLDQLQEANRRTCMRVRGWRRVVPSEQEAKRIAALSDADFIHWIAAAIGSPAPEGKAEGLGRAFLPDHPSINPDASPRGDVKLYIGGNADFRELFALRQNEGALVLAFRRPDKGSSGQRAAIVLRRYDLASADLATLPEGAPDESYFSIIDSEDRHAGYELHVVRLAPGTYVIDGTSVDGRLPAESNCFGAPLIEVPAGRPVYAGDWVPYRQVKLGDGKVLPDAMVMVPHFEEAKAVLARHQPGLAAALEPMAVANGATYSCTDPDIVLSRWSLSNVPEPLDPG